MIGSNFVEIFEVLLSGLGGGEGGALLLLPAGALVWGAVGIDGFFGQLLLLRSKDFEGLLGGLSQISGGEGAQGFGESFGAGTSFIGGLAEGFCLVEFGVFGVT